MHVMMFNNQEYIKMIEIVQNKIKAIQELFGDKEVILPVTFKIKNGNVTADIGQFTVNDNEKVVAEPEISKNVTTSEFGKWADKLPAKFISLAVRYNGVSRFVYYTLHNEGGIIKVLWKNPSGIIEEITPYITVREFSRGSMKYLMNLCNEDSSFDKWRDFDVFKIAPGNWNSVVKETLLTDPKAKDSLMTVVIYDIHSKNIQLVHLDEEDVKEIEEAIAKGEQEHR